MTNFKADEFWEKRLAKISGLEGVGYAKLGKQFNYWGYQVRKYAFMKIFNSLQKDISTCNVLDVGSGTGFYIDIWQKLGAANVTGVDITEVAVANLKKTFPTHLFFQHDISEDISNRKDLLGQFDFISTMDVLFHIVDDLKFEKAVMNIGSMLKQGGYFIYSDNFINGETVRRTHQVSHSKKELFEMFDKAGFEVIQHKPFMVLSNYPVDSKNPFLHVYWFLLENTVALVKPLGSPIGWLLYQVDKLLINLLDKSVSTEIVLLRKK
jgi:2-polyprenyl-3-methyl-5-hydroxy-6-metoxy-1,4-benzoquinol methylase